MREDKAFGFTLLRPTFYAPASMHSTIVISLQPTFLFLVIITLGFETKNEVPLSEPWELV
jgi:hypothetical protein